MAFKVKASLELPRKPVFGWLVSAGLSKKSLNPSGQVNLPIGFWLFFYPLRGCDGCAIGLPRLLTASARGGFTIVPPQRRAFPLVFSAEKTALPKRTPYQSGRLRSSAPRACEARRKRNRRKIGASLLAFVFSGFFFDIDCRVNYAGNFQCQRRFFVTFLTQESNVSHPSLTSRTL